LPAPPAALVRVTTKFFASVQVPGAVPIISAAAVLITAAVAVSLMPAARASRIDVPTRCARNRTRDDRRGTAAPSAKDSVR
jgi:hypothetical protein